jgi:hypothetical protein
MKVVFVCLGLMLFPPPGCLRAQSVANSTRPAKPSQSSVIGSTLLVYSHSSCLFLCRLLQLLGLRQENDIRRPLKPNDDHLGESLKDFRSQHKRASCHRRPSGEDEEKKLRAEWLTWVDCGFEGTTLVGVETIGNPSQSFGMFATFHDKKLVELGYTLADQSIAALFPSLVRKLGEPSQILFTEGELQLAAWVRWRETFTVEFLSLPPVATDRQFLRIGRGTPAHAARSVCI